MGFPSSSDGKKICLQCRRAHLGSWVGKIPWRRDRLPTPVFLGFLGGPDNKESTCNGLDPWVGKIPWRRAWQLTPVFLPGEFPWTEEPGRLWSMGLQRVRHDWLTKHSTQYKHNFYIYWETKNFVWLILLGYLIPGRGLELHPQNLWGMPQLGVRHIHVII